MEILFTKCIIYILALVLHLQARYKDKGTEIAEDQFSQVCKEYSKNIQYRF